MTEMFSCSALTSSIVCVKKEVPCKFYDGYNTFVIQVYVIRRIALFHWAVMVSYTKTSLTTFERFD